MEPVAYTALRERKFLAAIRAAFPETALAAANAVAKGGITMLEITFTVPDAPRVMMELSGRADVIVGAGTVLTEAQARTAISAGARFIVAPNLTAAVAGVAKEAGVMYCPGAYTTNEIIAARDMGAHVVKVYPVGVAGGPKYIEVIRDPLPDIPMLAAGGTTLENFVPFLHAGCVGIGLGGALADPKLSAAGKYDEITTRAKAFVHRLNDARMTGLVPKAPA
jgi:2-dehydro-3-deoxyphosphogluconate aldolase/(4S)-4-hydroxy-2-oxoglutarate aldolase